MNSICLFASYFKGNSIPYYVQVYLVELKKHFDTVVLISTQASLSDDSLAFLNLNAIDSVHMSNEGFDFGLWYKALQLYDTTQVQKLALVNDSCVLFKSLDNFIKWSSADSSDLQGITYSEAVSKHIQSYFLLINKQAIDTVISYFNKHKIITSIHEVISIYEIGLSQELLKKGFTINAYMDNDMYKGEFSPYYYCLPYHIQKGVPLIKKKIIYSTYREDELLTLARMNFKINPQLYIQLILRDNSDLLIDFSKLRAELKQGMSFIGRIRYNIIRLSIQALRPLYKLISAKKP